MTKLFFALITVFALSPIVVAAKAKPISQKICESLQTKIDVECAHIMCDEGIADGTFKNLDECTSGDDYAEAAQGGCDGQPTTMEGLVKAYNKKHPTAKVRCE